MRLRLINRLRRTDPRSERGQALVIGVVVMATLLVVMAYAIDTAIWYVHARHLQTQADAAALAGAQNFQYPCTTGATTSGTTDYAINGYVNQYNGTGLTPSNSPTYNAQYTNKTAATPSYTYSAGTHNVIPELNQPNFINQSFPNDKSPSTGNALTGSPCTDGVVDVKMTESNVPSYIPAWINPLSFITAPYINKEAEVAFQTVGGENTAEPFVEPLPNPASATATLVNENDGSTIASIPLTEVTVNNVADPTTLSGSKTLLTTLPNVPANGDVGVEINPSNTSTVYNTGSKPPYGIVYFHVWSAGTNAPYLEDAWLSGTSTCSTSPGTNSPSNFVSSSSSTSVQLCANVVVPTGTTCSTLDSNKFALTLNPGSVNVTANADCTATTVSGSTTYTTWTIPSQSVASASGGTNYTLSWAQSKNSIGTFTGCSNGNNNPCQGNFAGDLQQVFSGAFDSQSSQGSGSGSTLSATITNSTGNEISSESNATLSGQSVTVTIHSLSFASSSSTSNTTPTVLSFGSNQGNAALECAGSSEGSPQFQQNVADGCNSTYQTTTGSCPNTDSPPSCATENPGNGKLNQDLDPGMTARVYCGGVVSGCNVNKCPTTAGTDYNYWTGTNSLNSVLNQKPADPRLVTLLVTDNGGLGNGANNNGVPIREFATFYVTGWYGDPCAGNSGKSGTASNGLAYVPDDDPSAASPAECTTNNGSGNTLPQCSGILLGHFVTYVQSFNSGPSSGAPCGPGQLQPCEPVFVK